MNDATQGKQVVWQSNFQTKHLYGHHFISKQGNTGRILRKLKVFGEPYVSLQFDSEEIIRWRPVEMLLGFSIFPTREALEAALTEKAQAKAA